MEHYTVVRFDSSQELVDFGFEGIPARLRDSTMLRSELKQPVEAVGADGEFLACQRSWSASLSHESEQVTKWSVETERDLGAPDSIDVSAHTATAASKARAEGPETFSPATQSR